MGDSLSYIMLPYNEHTLCIAKKKLFIYLFIYLFNFASQADREPQQLAPITVAPFLTLPTIIRKRRQTTTPGTTRIFP